MLDWTQPGRSLMNSKNSNGPKTVPCGTPLMTGMFSGAFFPKKLVVCYPLENL